MRAVISDAVWALGRAVHRVADWIWDLADLIDGTTADDNTTTMSFGGQTLHVHTKA